jgi:acetyl-CoA synthetase (ADP-forming)
MITPKPLEKGQVRPAPHELVVQLDEHQSKTLVSRYGIEIPAGMPCRTEHELRRARAILNGDVVVKILTADVAHKSDVGGVRLGIRDEAELLRAAQSVKEESSRHGIDVDRVLVEELVASGHELIVGGIAESTFGPIIMLGMGGIFVEVLRDVSVRICPIDKRDAQSMIDELRSVSILRGARGRAPASEEMIIEALLRIGGTDGLLMSVEENILELDINPLIVTATRAVAADVHVVLGEGNR